MGFKLSVSHIYDIIEDSGKEYTVSRGNDFDDMEIYCDHVQLPVFPIIEDDEDNYLVVMFKDEGNVFATLNAYHEEYWDIVICKTSSGQDIRKHKFKCGVAEYEVILNDRITESSGNNGYIQVKFDVLEHDVEFVINIPQEGMDGEDEERELKEYE